MKEIARVLLMCLAAAPLAPAASTLKPAFAIYFNSEVRGALDPCG